MSDRFAAAEAATGAPAAVPAAATAPRGIGIGGLWLVALLLSIVAGEVGAVSLGGQSGRLLWADLLLGAGMLVALVARRWTLETPRAAFLTALLPLLAWSALGLLVARDTLTALAELKEWVAAALVGAAALAYATDARRARVLLWSVVVTGACVAALMAHAAFTSPLGPVLAVLMKRVDLDWGRSNYLAGLLILALPVALGLLGSSRGWPRAAALVALAALGGGLVLSASKGAILALLVGGAAAYLPAGREARGPRLALLAVVGAGALLFFAGPLREVAAYRLQGSALDYSAGERWDLYALAWSEFLRHPLVGLGLNNFSVAAHQLRGVDTVPHNLELGFLCELGLVGLALSMAWVWVVAATARRALRAATAGRERALALGLWAAVVAFLAHNQIESTLYGQQMKMLLMVTLAAAWRVGEGATPP